MYALIAMGAVCCITDIRSGKIYNAVTYPAIIVGLVLNGPLSMRLALLGFILGFVPFALASLRGMIGGGDAKLIGAVGAIGGFPYIMHFLFFTFILAGAFAIVILIWKKDSSMGLWRSIKQRTLRNPSSPAETNAPPKRTRIPMGAFVLLGILLTLRYV